ncbi:MAG: hypothetical protein AAF998_06405 [Bacteroidota bacterium]
MATTFTPSDLTRGLSPVLDLTGEWIDLDQGRIQVPFCDAESGRRDLGRNFDLQDYAALPDTLYLYFGGVAWTAELRLNDALLKVTEDPFREQLIPLQKALLRPRGNRITAVLRQEGPERRFAPRHFVGIFRDVWLLAIDPAVPPPVRLQFVDQASRAVVIAPWTAERGFLADTVALHRSLEGLFAYPYDAAIYLPFAPSARGREILAESGRAVLTDLSGADSVCFYNAYPIGANVGDFSRRFWRDTAGRPTAIYGTYLEPSVLEMQQIRPPDKLALLILLLIPVALLLLLKLVLPRVYGTLPEYLTKTKIYLELIAGAKFLKDEQRLLMNGMRMIMLAVMVSLYLYYVGLFGTWDKLNLLSDESFLYHYFSGSSPSLYEIFLKSLLVVFGLNFVKYIFLNLTGGIFRVLGFSSMVQNLDIFSAFPLNLLPLAPAAVIFFVDIRAGTVLLLVWNIVILIYLFRRLVLIYGGLTKLFQFSTGLKFLYICSLEIAPWVFLI